jgi:hypothetical protein
MIPPDQEIFEVEQRLALRRTQLKRHAGEARRRAMQALASPVALIAAAGLGFLAANSFARRHREPPHPERRKSDHTKAAKATGLAGLLTTAAMWFIRAQYGSPVRAAQTLLEKFKGRKASTSAPSDVRSAPPSSLRAPRHVRP